MTGEGTPSAGSRFAALLGRRVDPASLAAFRVSFGVVMIVEALLLFVSGDLSTWIEAYYQRDPVQWTFAYPGFSWVAPWPTEPLMIAHATLLGLSGLLLAIGLFTRAAAAGVLLTWGYVFLLDRAFYNNHYYLAVLIAFLLVFIPSERAFSLDRLRAERKRGENARDDAPFWPIFLLRAQLIIVYFYGGVVKLSNEWLLHAEPMRTWLAEPRATGFFGLFLSPGSGVWDFIHSAGFAFFMSYAGLVYDLAIGLLFLFRRTRILALVLTAFFHAFNHCALFADIGAFPLMGFTLSLVFLEPDWPRRLAARFSGKKKGPRDAATTPRALDVAPATRRVAILVAAYVAIQALLPLRHFFIEGPANWTGEGGRFSWRMKSSYKRIAHQRLFVYDDAILGVAAGGGGARVDWERLGQPPVVYQQVDGSRLDWGGLPPFFIVFQPLLGERVIYNPYSRAAEPETGADGDAAVRAAAAWTAATGHEPESVRPTIGREELLGALAKEPALRGALGDLGRLAARLEDPGLPIADRHQVAAAFRERLQALARHPAHGSHVTRLRAQLHPFALEGAPGRGRRFLEILDDELVRPADNGYRSADPRIARLGADPRKTVLADLPAFGRADWLALPPVTVARDETGRLALVWNYDRDLLEPQSQAMATTPDLCHQYAQRVARLWQERFGRRPGVYALVEVALLPHRPQMIIDPSVDLAAAPISLFGHNDWIRPIER